MSGTYPAGYRMGIDELARDLGVSTMPVREALVALANEGLLEVLPRRGFRVAAISRQDVEDVFRVHALVAGELAERAARAIDAETIARLKEVQEDIESISQSRMAASVRSTRIEQANYTFHRMINHASDSERLRWFLRAATRFVPRQFYVGNPRVDGDSLSMITRKSSQRLSSARQDSRAELYDRARVLGRGLGGL